MREYQRPETIENQWDILYRDYPEVYDSFTSVKYIPSIDLNGMFGIEGKRVVDIGSGTGKSSFYLARYAEKVIGVEPEEAMLEIARNNLKSSKFKNIFFLKGSSDSIPLPDGSADFVIGMTVASFYEAGNINRFVKEAKRVLITGGSIISVDIAPGWYGGELAPVILGRSRRREGIDFEVVRNDAFTALGFRHTDRYQTQEYGSLENIISTYGFIFGRKSINYLQNHKKTSIKWKFRIYYYTKK